MADVHNKQIRSKNMSAIGRRDTAPELWLRKQLFAKGYRYRLGENYLIQAHRLPGKPDIVLPRYRCVVFVHGCFWHRHLCGSFRWPKTRVEWWQTKLNGNAERDLRTQSELVQVGWRVLTIWECAIRGKQKRPPESVIEDVRAFLISNVSTSEISGTGPE